MSDAIRHSWILGWQLGALGIGSSPPAGAMEAAAYLDGHRHGVGARARAEVMGRVYDARSASHGRTNEDEAARAR